jgi:hypothetical protein
MQEYQLEYVEPDEIEMEMEDMEEFEGLHNGDYGVRISHLCIDLSCTTGNGRLPCVKMFAMRFSSGARQTSTLPCVFRMTHVKQKRTVSIYFAVRF